MALPLTCDRTVDPTEGMPAVTATLNYLAPMTGRLISTYSSSDGVPRTNGNFEGREVLVRDLNALVFPHRVGETYAVSYNPAHRWYYAPGMDRDEALLIKCYDSVEDGVARFVPHTSFDDPATPPSARGSLLGSTPSRWSPGQGALGRIACWASSMASRSTRPLAGSFPSSCHRSSIGAMTAMAATSKAARG